MTEEPRDRTDAGTDAAQSAVWHPKFGFGLFDAKERASIPPSAVAVDFGPHWERQLVAVEPEPLSCAPTPAAVKLETMQIGPWAVFEAQPDPARVGARSPVSGDEKLKAALASWDDAVGWIERGWDCIDEYLLDVSVRVSLQRAMGALAAGRGRLQPEWVAQMHAADRRFLAATVGSALCVWHSGQPYQHVGGYTCFPHLQWYDADIFWYLYRWPPDTDVDIHSGDALAYWRLHGGLDFRSMTKEELSAQVRAEVERADRWLQSRKLRVRPPEAPKSTSGAPPRAPCALSNLAVGQQVFHWKFGRGQVLGVEWVRGKEKARVDFGAHGIRWMDVEIARLVDPDARAASSVGAAWKDLVDESRPLVPLGREPWAAWFGPALAADDAVLRATLTEAFQSVQPYPVGGPPAEPGWPEVTVLLSPATARRERMVLAGLVALLTDRGEGAFAMLPQYTDWSRVHVVMPRHIRTCARRIEALVEGDLRFGDDVLPIAFGLPTFVIGCSDLRPGAEVSVALTALAFECEPAPVDPIHAQHPSEMVEAIRRSGMELDLDADGAAIYQVKGVSVWLADPGRGDIVEFRGRVQRVEKITLPPGRRAAWKLLLRAWRAAAGDWLLDLVFEAYVWPDAQEPAVGSDVQGRAWLVGECLGPVPVRTR